jgi:hypothetical protein
LEQQREERKTKSGPGETGPNTPLSKPSPGDPRGDELAVREEGAEILLVGSKIAWVFFFPPSHLDTETRGLKTVLAGQIECQSGN